LQKWNLKVVFAIISDHNSNRNHNPNGKQKKNYKKSVFVNSNYTPQTQATSAFQKTITEDLSKDALPKLPPHLT